MQLSCLPVTRVLVMIWTSKTSMELRDAFCYALCQWNALSFMPIHRLLQFPARELCLQILWLKRRVTGTAPHKLYFHLTRGHWYIKNCIPGHIDIKCFHWFLFILFLHGISKRGIVLFVRLSIQFFLSYSCVNLSKKKLCNCMDVT